MPAKNLIFLELETQVLATIGPLDPEIYKIYYSDLDSLYEWMLKEHTSKGIGEYPQTVDRLRCFDIPATPGFLGTPQPDIWVFCSAALITCSTVSNVSQKPYVCYMRIDTSSGTHMPVQELDLGAIFGLSDSKYNFVKRPNITMIQQEKFCCIGLEARNADQSHLDRGVYRRICLLILRWSDHSEKMTTLATSVIEVQDRVLTSIPNSSVNHQVDIARPIIEFLKSGKHLLAVYHPCPKNTPAIIVYCLYQNTFVPVTGNKHNYPGLYTFSDSEFCLRTYHYKTFKKHFMMGKVVNRHSDGRSSYQFCRLLLK